MADNIPPANVKDLLAKVGTATANIAKHRAAMADVAATVRTTPKGTTPNGGTTP